MTMLLEISFAFQYFSLCNWNKVLLFIAFEFYLQDIVLY